MIRSFVFCIVATSCIFQIESYRPKYIRPSNPKPEVQQPILQTEGEDDHSPESGCMESPRPSSGKVARLILELLKLLEGESSTLSSTLTRHLVTSHLLIHPSLLDAEPDLETLVKAPVVMMGEPHAFPKILALVWLVATDPEGLEKSGWCDIGKVNHFLSTAKPLEVARKIRSLEPILEQTKMIMDDFVKNMTRKFVANRRSENTATPTPTIVVVTTKAEPSTSLIVPELPNIQQSDNITLSPKKNDNNHHNSAFEIVFEKSLLISVFFALSYQLKF